MKLTPILLALLAFIAFQQPAPGEVVLAAPEAPLLSPEELDGLLAPIALHPDPLIAAILLWATFPLEIVLSDRFLMSGGDPNEAQQQECDNSVQALLQYPQLLQWMDDNLPWTMAVGQAFLAQPQDVLDSIQRL